MSKTEEILNALTAFSEDLEEDAPEMHAYSSDVNVE